jgi:hypothetical protein
VTPFEPNRFSGNLLLMLCIDLDFSIHIRCWTWNSQTLAQEMCCCYMWRFSTDLIVIVIVNTVVKYRR